MQHQTPKRPLGFTHNSRLTGWCILPNAPSYEPNPAQFRSRITLLTVAETPDPNSTGTILTPTNTLERWARLMPVRTAQTIAGIQLDLSASDATHQAEMWFLESIDLFTHVTRTQHTADGNRTQTFRVLSSADCDLNRRFMRLDLQLMTDAVIAYPS